MDGQQLWFDTWDQGQSWKDWRQKGNEAFGVWLFVICSWGTYCHSCVLFDFQMPSWHCVMVYPSACVVNPTGFVCGLCKTPGNSPNIFHQLFHWTLVFMKPVQWALYSTPKLLSKWPAGCFWPISFYFVSPNLLSCLYIIISPQKSHEEASHVLSIFLANIKPNVALFFI